MIDRVIVDGVDLQEVYGLILTYESEVKPPLLVEHYLEIPGMDGCLDLTESLKGDASYSPRIQEFIFDFQGDQYQFEDVKTKVSNFLHGRAHDYELTFDPGYIYHGRFALDSYYTLHRRGEIKFNVTADPWKRAESVHLSIAAASGVNVTLFNRRRRVSPTITVLRDTVIGFGTHSWALGPGEHYLNELVLEPGENHIFVDSKPTDGTNTWADVVSKLGNPTWNQIKDMTWAELAKYGQSYTDDATTAVVIDYPTYDL